MINVQTFFSFLARQMFIEDKLLWGTEVRSPSQRPVYSFSEIPSD
jgi:hypothetical protein